MSFARNFPAASARGESTDWRAVGQLQSQIEKHFLDMGQFLVRTGNALEDLRDPIKQLTQMNESTLTSTHHRLLIAKERCLELQDAMMASVASIDTLNARVDVLARELKALWKSVRTMKIVGLNAKVSASEISGRHTGLDVFTSATGEIVQNSERVLLDADVLLEDIRRRSNKLATEGLGRQLDDMRQFAQNLAELCLMFERLQGGGQNNLHLGTGLARRCEELHSSLGDGLVALQIGDATRQRLEHCQSIVSNPEYTVHPQLEELARAQLREATSNFSQDSLRLSDGLTRALGLSSELAGGQAPPAAEGAQSLLERLREIAGSADNQLCILRVILEQSGEHTTALDADFENLSKLLRAVGALEEQMRIVGMNAVIGCGKLGNDGMALKEIAGQLGSLAADNARIYHDVKKALEEIETHIESFIAMMKRPSDLIDGIETETRGIIQEVENLSELGSRMRSGLLRAASEVSEGLPKARRELEGLRASLETEAKRGRAAVQPLPTLPDMLDAEIFALYSIEEERSLHRRLFGQTVSASLPTQQDDDIFF